MQRKCKYCGKVFETNNTNRLYCSPECSNKWRHDSKRRRCQPGEQYWARISETPESAWPTVTEEEIDRAIDKCLGR